MNTLLFVITIIVGCNGNYDPLNHHLDTSNPLQIKDASGNVILKRATNTDNKWKLGTIDGCDLSRYEDLSAPVYKWVTGYEWKYYRNDVFFQHDQGSKKVYLLLDPQGVFNGMYPVDGHFTQITHDLPTNEAAVCHNVNIFCYPNKIEPQALFEKHPQNTNRPMILSRRIVAGHDGFDVIVDPNTKIGKWPWRIPGECDDWTVLDQYANPIKLTQTCPEYEFTGNTDKWYKNIWNLFSSDSATKQKWKIVWDATTHQHRWEESGGIGPIGNGPKAIKVNDKKWRNFGIYRDKQGIAGECVMNTVNTLLGQRYWNNKQYYTEFCKPYVGETSDFCEEDTRLQKRVHATSVMVNSNLMGQIYKHEKFARWGNFRDETADMALSKVGAFEYKFENINKLYYELNTNDQHKLLGIRIAYNPKGGSGGHATAFPWDGSNWYYVNSHTVKPIAKYDGVLDMIQDIKKNFNRFHNIWVVRVLVANSNIVITPDTVDRTIVLEGPKISQVDVIEGGGIKKRDYNWYTKKKKKRKNFKSFNEIPIKSNPSHSSNDAIQIAAITKYGQHGDIRTGGGNGETQLAKALNDNNYYNIEFDDDLYVDPYYNKEYSYEWMYILIGVVIIGISGFIACFVFGAYILFMFVTFNNMKLYESVSNEVESNV